MEILPLTSAEFADSLISDVFYEIATTVDKLMTNSKKTIPAFIWMIKPLFVWYNYITFDSGPCIWMSAKMKYQMEIVIRCNTGIYILV
jgi:hypothetical protein